ncbi:kinase-like domain-containing protein [Suillus clintonianus]|uniref:kinase-like domain-containing protein n=1 Tax=Suillus clintonianus TaxID=1904413 RepID=UPI001B8749A3|nr:kinase-like domain-containing protein [Suillus clintonianus]KAG2153303.1 kinase-like domain-containing protein [Suillus clintonianus]
MSLNLTNTTSTVNDLTGMVDKTEQIANGHCGEVWKGTYTAKGGQPVIVQKTMRVNSLTSQFKIYYSAKYFQRLLREIRVWSKCIDPHVAPFIGICYEVTRGHRVPCLVSPFYENRTITQYLKNNPNAIRMDLLRQFISGLAYLHQPGRAIVHGDIKPTNILIDDTGKAVLADFGHSRILGVSGFTTITTTTAGTFRYMAPELMVPETHDSTPTPTTASDVWAAGMTGLEIISGRIPYVEYKTDSQLVEAMVADRLPDGRHYPLVRHGAWTAFEQCWRKVPTRRPDMQEVKNYLDREYGPDSKRSARPTRTRG